MNKKYEWFVHSKHIDFDVLIGTPEEERHLSINDYLAKLEDEGWEIVSISPYTAMSGVVIMVHIIARRNRRYAAVRQLIDGSQS